MEKIQSAIAKARDARSKLAPAGGDSPGAAPDQRRPAAYGAAGAVPAVWAALPAFVPNAPLLVRNRIVTHAGGAEAVDFDVMRTRLLQQMRANGWRRVAVTSPGASCGKTTIVLNLGFSLARQADTRTVVAELDLRRPSIARTLGLKPRAGFAGVLTGEAAFEDCVSCYNGNLAIATNQGPVRNSAELLAGPTVAAALSDIESRYDPTLMIVDMPPMLVSDDVMAFAGQVDCVLLVAAAESSTIKEIDACERDLAAQTNVLGVVLNKCRYTERSAGYGAYG